MECYRVTSFYFFAYVSQTQFRNNVIQRFEYFQNVVRQSVKKLKHQLVRNSFFSTADM